MLFISYYSYTSLYHHGDGYKTLRNWNTNSPIPGFFYTYEDDDIKKNNNKKIKNKEFVDDQRYLHKTKFNYKRKNWIDVDILGLGDFFFFNLMILFIIQPEWSITTKFFVVCGCITSIQVGHYGTLHLLKICQLNNGPALPFPVVTFSIYAIIVYVFI